MRWGLTVSDVVHYHDREEHDRAQADMVLEKEYTDMQATGSRLTD